VPRPIGPSPPARFSPSDLSARPWALRRSERLASPRSMRGTATRRAEWIGCVRCASSEFRGPTAMQSSTLCRAWKGATSVVICRHGQVPGCQSIRHGLGAHLSCTIESFESHTFRAYGSPGGAYPMKCFCALHRQVRIDDFYRSLQAHSQLHVRPESRAHVAGPGRMQYPAVTSRRTTGSLGFSDGWSSLRDNAFLRASDSGQDADCT
jgi:hypothetical protein